MGTRVYGARMRQARALRVVPSSVVAEHMGWSRARQSKLELRDSVFTLDDPALARLGALCGFPAGFFTTAPGSRVTVGDLLFRPTRMVSASAREFLAAMVNVIGDLVSLEPGFGQRGGDRGWEPARDAMDVQAAGAAARRHLEVGDGAPIGDVIGQMESVGIAVAMLPEVSFDTAALTGTHDGCSARAGYMRDQPVVLLPPGRSWEQLRLAAAHEIGHLMLHPFGGIRPAEERAASAFAAEFLAPAAALELELPATVTLGGLLALKQRWGLSLAALIPHLLNSRLIGEDRARTLQRQLYSRINRETGCTWGKTEPGQHGWVREAPRLLAQIVENSRSGKGGAMALPQDLLAAIASGQSVLPAAAYPAFRQQVGGDRDRDHPDVEDALGVPGRVDMSG